MRPIVSFLKQTAERSVVAFVGSFGGALLVGATHITSVPTGVSVLVGALTAGGTAVLSAVALPFGDKGTASFVRIAQPQLTQASHRSDR